jgi:hypothetical protein
VEFLAGGTPSLSAVNIADAINEAELGFTAVAVGAVITITHNLGGADGNVDISRVNGQAGTMTLSGAALTGGSDAGESETLAMNVTNGTLTMTVGGSPIGTISWDGALYSTNTRTPKWYFEELLRLGHARVNRAGIPLYRP